MTDTQEERLTAEQLREVWPILSPDDRLEGFRVLPPLDAEEFFLSISASAQAACVLGVPPQERRRWMRLLAPDDAADTVQEADPAERAGLIALLDDTTRREVGVLLAYEEDHAGGLMSPRFARIRPEMTVDEAIAYLRRQARDHLETIYYAYILDANQRLLGAVSFRDLFTATGSTPVSAIMKQDLTTVPDTLDQEAVASIIARSDLMAVPVLDAEGRMKGIVTVDDIVDVVNEEATEDIQKLGGMAALERPYLRTGLFAMLKKRAGWLAVLFLGELLTASAMGHYEAELAHAIVLALFIPLIISSGGNSGSQATTLVIRAMALGQVQLRDWWLVVRREAATGLGLGVILAGLGLVRVLIWQGLFGSYGDHALRIAFTVALSLVGVVLWGTLAGSMLPFLLRRLGFDPASASAPFVATLVDVSGLVIYFNVAQLFLSQMML